MQHYTAVLSKLFVCLFLAIPLLAGCVGEGGVLTEIPVVDNVDLTKMDKEGRLLIAWGFSPEEIAAHFEPAKQRMQATANGLDKDVGGLKPYHVILFVVSLKERASETIAKTFVDIVCKPSEGKQISDLIVKVGFLEYKDPNTSMNLVVVGHVIDARFIDCAGKPERPQLKPSEKPPLNPDESIWV